MRSSEQMPRRVAVTPPESASVSSVRLPVPIRMSASRQPVSELRVSLQRGREPEMDRIEDRVEDRRNPAFVGGLGRPQQRRQVAVAGRNEHGRCAAVARNVERVFGEAQQERGARLGGAAQFLGRGRVDADRQAGSLELANGVFEMRERRVRQTAEIDHVGARRPHGGGARENGIDGQGRRIDDLGEYAHVLTGEIETAAVLSEVCRQVLQFLRPALEPDAEVGAQAVEIGAAAAGHQDPIGLHRTRHAARDDRLGHERSDLDADIEDRPFEPGVLDAGQNLLEPRPGEMTGEKEDALSHALRAHACGGPMPVRAPKEFRPPACRRRTSVARYSRDRCDAERP